MNPTIGLLPFIQSAAANPGGSSFEPIHQPTQNVLTIGLKTGAIIGSSFALSSVATVLGKTAKNKLALGLMGGAILPFV